MGNQSTSHATITRLQTQLNGMQQDTELIVNQKNELEKIVKQQKQETLEAERKATDYYNQLLSTKENFQILHNEQKMLSDELTQKQREMQQVEKVKLNQERELLQLRPLKEQLNNLDWSHKQQIEAQVKIQYENNKLQKMVTEQNNDIDRLRSELEDMVTQNFTLTE